ncbi:MAG: PhoH family protein [Actinobacteria bacterium]|nr:PhoH family protein [Actinomycetota bacterium]
MLELLGNQDSNLRLVENNLNVEIFVLGDKIEIEGEEEATIIASEVISELIKQANQGQELDVDTVLRTIDAIEAKDEYRPHQLYNDSILTYRGKIIRPKTPGQKGYVDAIRKNTLVFAIGPAGTGKTYLAMAMAVSALSNKEVSRVILVRPVVEAGEKLGFLPGDLYEKVDPYLRPLYDALFEMMGAEQFHNLMDRGIIEVAPLAYMRGRTLNDSFIILDEAQNTSPEQMKMFLTRLGFGSKAVVTGDITQIDLPEGKFSGLKTVAEILDGLDDIEFCYLDSRDVVRHRLVQKIVNAYKLYEEKGKSSALKRKNENLAK